MTRMAIKAVKTHLENGFLVVWSNLVSGDPTGDAFRFTGQTDCIVHVIGTMSTATLSIDGSFNNTDFGVVVDPNLNAISVTALGFFYILTPADFMRPSLAGADGSTDISVFIRAYKRRIS